MSVRAPAPAGDRALFVDLAVVTAEQLHAHARAWRAVVGEGVVVGHSSLLIRFRTPAELRSFVSAERVPSPVQDDGSEEGVAQHLITVEFSESASPDLPELLTRCRLSRSGFLRQIADLRLRVRFHGFRPGFAYLEGWPEEWSLPRRPTSRNHVPAGSFAIADSMAAFYPAASAGGWNILGRSAASFWDPLRNPPQLLRAGDEVRIVPSEVAVTVSGRPGGAVNVSEGAGPVATVETPGQRTLIVGGEQISRGEMGLGAGGPYDHEAAAAANAAVGNPSEEALLECTLVGPRLRILRPVYASWCGAEAELSVNGLPLHATRQFHLEAGDVLDIGPLRGMRGYLAVGGGVLNPAPRWAAMPSALDAGQVLFLQGGAGTLARIVARDRARRCSIQVIAGPHAVDRETLRRLEGTRWSVTRQLDRTGIRLSSDGLGHALPSVLPTGMQFGTAQLHPNGDLVLMGPDHPVTGGYPQPFTVRYSELWKLGQLTPGDQVTFQIVSAPGSG